MKAPDLLCRRDKRKFYVEVRCLPIAEVTKKTRLAHPRSSGPGFWKPLTDMVFTVLRRKARQCADLDAPSMVAVGTFHVHASSLCVEQRFVEDLLTGERLITCPIDKATGAASGPIYESTKLKSAAFVRPDSAHGLASARGSVSAVLVCGLGFEPPRVLGALHPSPAREFDRRLLPNIEFCRLRIDEQAGALSAEWV